MSLKKEIANMPPPYSPNNGVDRYRSPESGSRATTVLPVFSGRRANSLAAHRAAPEEMPTRMPAFLPKSRAAAKAESLCYDKLPENAILQSVTTTYEEIDGVILAECVMVTKESIGLTKEISN